LPLVGPEHLDSCPSSSWPYTPECVEVEFSEVELPFYGVLRSSSARECSVVPGATLAPREPPVSTLSTNFVRWDTYCAGAHTCSSEKRMLRSSREQQRCHVKAQDSYLPSSYRRTRYLQATKKPESRRTGSAPSKAAEGAPISPPPTVGGDYALLPCGLALLATQRTRRIRCARGVFCPCGGECGACGSRIECSRSFAERKLPADPSGGATADR